MCSVMWRTGIWQNDIISAIRLPRPKPDADCLFVFYWLAKYPQSAPLIAKLGIFPPTKNTHLLKYNLDFEIFKDFPYVLKINSSLSYKPQIFPQMDNLL